MRIVGLLPMKGNSERVPNKNLKAFDGKPLYHWLLETLLESRYIEKVIINTDSSAIAEDAIASFGEERIIIHDRPENIRGDLVSMNEIIKYDIQKVSSDFYIQTHSTNPLLSKKTIDNAIEKMNVFSEDDKYDSIFSVTRLQTRLYDKHAQPFNHSLDKLLRTQDLEPLFEENSNFYIFTKESFTKANNNRIGTKPFMYEMDKIEAVDIDEPQDFSIAENLHKTKFHNNDFIANIKKQ